MAKGNALGIVKGISVFESATKHLITDVCSSTIAKASTPTFSSGETGRINFMDTEYIEVSGFLCIFILLILKII